MDPWTTLVHRRRTELNWTAVRELQPINFARRWRAFPDRSRPISCWLAVPQMGSRPITFLWLWTATDQEPRCRHVPINRTWRWTESTPRSGRWRSSRTAGIYSDCSTREINNGCVYYIEPATMKSDLPTTTFGHQDMDRIGRIHLENREEWRTRPASDARDATFIAIVTRFSRLLHTQFPSVRWGCSVAQSPIGFALNCASARQITTPAPHHSVFTGRMPFLPPNQQR